MYVPTMGFTRFISLHQIFAPSENAPELRATRKSCNYIDKFWVP